LNAHEAQQAQVWAAREAALEELDRYADEAAQRLRG